MRVLMISLDKTLLGADYSGDVLERHQEYAQKAGQVDMIILSKKGFKRRKINFRLAVYPTNSLTKLNYIFDAFKIAKQIYWSDKFDLVVGQDPFLAGLAGWLIKKKFKVPLLIHFHGDFWGNKYWLFEKNRWWFNWFFLTLSKFLVSGADGIRTTSSGIKDKLIRGGVDKKKIRVIPTPVNIEEFGNPDWNQVKEFRQIHKHYPTVLNVARRDNSKDFKNLFKTFYLISQKIPKIVFWQVGAGFKKEETEKIIEKRFPEETILSFTGQAAHKGAPKTERNDLINIYHAADIYVSSSCHESFGKVLVEAMAAGLPVVATATTGSKEIVVDGQSGFLAPIGDSHALAEKILYLFNNPEKARQMGKAGRRMVKIRFNRQKNIQKIVNFWRDLVR